MTDTSRTASAPATGLAYSVAIVGGALLWLATMGLSGGSGFGLLPLGMIMFAILSLPAIAIARIAAGIRLRRTNG